MRLFIGSSSNMNMPEKYTEDCTKLLEVILKENDLVFGARDEGLMGVSYRIAKKNNRKVIAMCPEVYKESLEPLECDEVILTKTMLESTLEIYQNCDAILFLPGGFGTIYEFFTANYSKICKDVDVPIIIYNSLGFFDKALSFIDEVTNMGLVRDSEKGKFYVANSIEEVVQYLTDK